MYRKMYIFVRFLSEYLQQESKDKKGKELNTSGWTLHSKKRNVSPTCLSAENII